MDKMKVAVFLLIAGIICLAAVQPLQSFVWRSVADIGFKALPVLPDFLIPIAIEFYLMRLYPLFGVTLALRLLAFVLLTAGVTVAARKIRATRQH